MLVCIEFLNPSLNPESDYQKKQRESLEYEIKAMQIWVGYEIMGVKKITLNLCDKEMETETEKLAALIYTTHEIRTIQYPFQCSLYIFLSVHIFGFKPDVGVAYRCVRDVPYFFFASISDILYHMYSFVFT